jgi:hypothetical protein
LLPPVGLTPLAAWMYERGIAAAHITQVLKFGGGNQNIVVRLTLARSYAPELSWFCCGHLCSRDQAVLLTR